MTEELLELRNVSIATIQRITEYCLFVFQSYGRVSEQGKVLQTFVQSVAPGTPAFFAGLYPGDAIVEVNGLDVKYSPMDVTVEAIKKEATKGDR